MNLVFRRALLVLLFPLGLAALAPSPLTGRYRQRIWTVVDGLPQNSVYGLAQDKDGYLWVGTLGGLARFNGHEFKTYPSNVNDNLPSDRIIQLWCDPEGRLWIGTENHGTLWMQAGRFFKLSNDRDVAGAWARTYQWERGGTFLIGTSRGLFRMSRDSNTRWRAHLLLTGRLVTWIYQDHEGTMWLGTDRGLWRAAGASFEPVRSTPTGISWVFCVTEHPQGIYWIGTSKGLYRMEGARWSLFQLANEKNPPSIQNLYLDRRGNLWAAAAQDGVYRLHPDASGREMLQEFFPIPRPMTLFEDREGSMWVGTDGNGVYQFTEGIVEAIGGPQSVLEVSTTTVLDDGEGGWWVGTYRRGLAHVTPHKIIFPEEHGLLEAEAVLALYRDPSGTLWIGTQDRGLLLLKNGRMEPGPYLPGGIRPVQAIAGDMTGRIVIGTHSGLFFFDPTHRSLRMAERTQDLTIRNILVAGSTLWLATDSGVVAWSPSGMERWDRSRGLSHNSIRALYRDRQGTLWIGTYGGGLNRLAHGKLTSLSTADGLFDNMISFIAEDDHGRLWLTGNQGIFRVALETLDAVAEGRQSQLVGMLLTEQDGMRVRECNGGGQPAGAFAPDGRLAVPTVDGIAIVNTREETRNPLPPPVHIEAFLAGDRLLPQDPPPVLPPGPAHIEIRFAALSWVAPAEVRYRIKLEGLDVHWSPPQETNRAYYNNLPPGNYIFRVKGCNNDGVWNTHGAAFAFRILPHYYQTAWFLACCLGSLVLAFFGAFQIHTLALRRRERTLEDQVKARTAELEELQALTGKINEVVLLEEVLMHVEAAFHGLVPFDQFWFTAYDQEKNVLSIVLARSFPGDMGTHPEPLPIRTGGRLEAILQSGAPTILELPSTADSSTSDGLDTLLSGKGLGSVLAVPSRIQGHPVGILLFGSHARGVYTQNHIRLIGQVAGQVATIIEKTRLFEELMQMNEMKDRFFGMAAHDLRHPLGALMMYLELLRDNAIGPLSEDQDRYIRAMGDACKSMSKLINDLLDYSALESGALAMNLQSVNLADLISGILGDYRMLAAQKEISVEAILPESVPSLYADAMRIRQVLDNMASNAVKFSHVGGRIRIGLEVEETLLRVRITDHGVGIAGEDRHRLFQPFFKGSRRSPSGEKSTGLGLALCRRIVDAHFGTIGFECREGETEFYFTLPLMSEFN